MEMSNILFLSNFEMSNVLFCTKFFNLEFVLLIMW